jgi:hypothetical protein
MADKKRMPGGHKGARKEPNPQRRDEGNGDSMRSRYFPKILELVNGDDTAATKIFANLQGDPQMLEIVNDPAALRAKVQYYVNSLGLRRLAQPPHGKGGSKVDVRLKVRQTALGIFQDEKVAAEIADDFCNGKTVENVEAVFRAGPMLNQTMIKMYKERMERGLFAKIKDIGMFDESKTKAILKTVMELPIAEFRGIVLDDGKLKQKISMVSSISKKEWVPTTPAWTPQGGAPVNMMSPGVPMLTAQQQMQQQFMMRQQQAAMLSQQQQQRFLMQQMQQNTMVPGATPGNKPMHQGATPGNKPMHQGASARMAQAGGRGPPNSAMQTNSGGTGFQQAGQLPLQRAPTTGNMGHLIQGASGGMAGNYGPSRYPPYNNPTMMNSGVPRAFPPFQGQHPAQRGNRQAMPNTTAASTAPAAPKKNIMMEALLAKLAKDKAAEESEKKTMDNALRADAAAAKEDSKIAKTGKMEPKMVTAEKPAEKLKHAEALGGKPKLSPVEEVRLQLLKRDLGGDGATDWEKEQAKIQTSKDLDHKKNVAVTTMAAQPARGTQRGDNSMGSLLSGMQNMQIAKDTVSKESVAAPADTSGSSRLIPSKVRPGDLSKEPSLNRAPVQPRKPPTTPVVATKKPLPPRDMSSMVTNKQPPARAFPITSGVVAAQAKTSIVPKSLPVAAASSAIATIPNKPGWEVKATEILLPLVKSLGGGLKSKSICATLVKLGYNLTMKMIGNPDILKEEFQRAKSGPAAANLLSQTGQQRMRQAMPMQNMQRQGGGGGFQQGNRAGGQARGGGGGGQSIPSGPLTELPPPALGSWIPKQVDPTKVKSVNELRAICEESKFCREKPPFLMGLSFLPAGPTRKPSARQRAMENLMNKPLVRSENAWKPASKKASKDAKVEDPVAVIKRKANLHLNKLTRENFGKILDEILGLKVDSYEGLEQMVSSLFKKAITQSYLGDVFADFSVELSKSTSVWQEELIKIEQKDRQFYWTAGPTLGGGPYASSEVAKKEGKKKTQFKRILLTKCQHEFNKSEQLETEMKALDEKDFTKEEAAKHKDKLSTMKKDMLGNINFIGELYKKKMLPEVALENCFNKLLPQRVDQAPEEDNIDMCCRLLTSVGPKLDKMDGSGRKKKAEKDAKSSSKQIKTEAIQGYYESLRQIWTSKVLSNKVNFQILDLLDLRKNRWRERREKVVAKTKAEIAKDFEREERQKEMESRGGGRGFNNRGGDRRGGGDDRRQGRSSIGSGDIRGSKIVIQPNQHRRQSSQGSNDSRGSRPPASPISSTTKTERPQLKLQKRTKTPETSKKESTVSAKVATWPQDKIDRDLKATLTEYMSENNLDELQLAVSDTSKKSGVKKLGVALTACIFQMMIDCKTAQRPALNTLCQQLLKANSSVSVLSAAEFLEGLSVFAVELPDLKYDAPKCDEWVAAIVGPLISDGLIQGKAVKKCLKPVLDDPFNGQIIAQLALAMMANITANIDEGIHKLVRQGLAWIFSNAKKSSTAERMVSNMQGLLSQLLPGIALSVEFYKKLFAKEDPSAVSAWLTEAFKNVNISDNVSLGDLAFGVTAAVFADAAAAEVPAEWNDVLKMTISNEDVCQNGCTDAIDAIGPFMRWKPADKLGLINALAYRGVLKSSAVEYWKEWQ